MRAVATILPMYTPLDVAQPSLLRRYGRQAGLIALAALYGVAMALLPAEMIAAPLVPILILLLLTLWLLPDRTTFPDTAIEQSLYWFVLLYYIWPAYIAIALPGLPWFSAGRIALLVLMLITFYSIATSGVLRRHLMATARTSRLLWALFLTQLTAQVLPLIWAARPIGTLTKFGYYQLYWTGLFFVGLFVFTRAGRATKFIGAMLVIAMVMAAFGILEYHQETLFWAAHIPSFLKVDDAALIDIVLGGQRREYTGAYRVHSTFTVSLIFAEFLAMLAPFVLHYLVTGRGFWLRLGLAATLAMFALCIWYTDSRLGRAGLLIAIGAYAVIWALRLRNRMPSSVIGSAVVFGIPIAALGGIGLVFASHRLSALVFGSEVYQTSNDARGDQWALGIPKLLANPFGYGAGNSGLVLNYINLGGRSTIDVHYLKMALEFGIIGAVAFYAMCAWAAWLGIKLFFQARERELELAGPAGITLAIFVIIKGVLAEDYNSSLTYLLVAMILALTARHMGLIGARGLHVATETQRASAAEYRA